MIVLLVQLLVVLGLLLWADRWLHQHLQGVMLLLTGDDDIALWLYAIVLLPGVALHELSHAAVARVVGVKIGRVNIFPQRSSKRVQLGFVLVQETDFFRASLIGGAPLIAGSIAVVAIGYLVFGTPEILAALSAGAWWDGLRNLAQMLQAPDVWLWVYLVFAVGNTMLPSRSDIHAWPFTVFAAVAVAAMIVVLGGTSFLLIGASQFLTIAVRWLVLLGASVLLADLPIFATMYLLQKLLERVRDVRIEYR